MNQILSLSLFIIIGLFSSQSNAQKTIKLNPKETKQLTNSTLWTLNATCTVQSQDTNKGKIKISLIKNKGSINGKTLSSGQSTLVTVADKNTIHVSAESGTAINLSNLSSKELQAVCSI